MHIAVFLLIIYTSKCLQAKVPPIACNAAHCNPNYEPYSNIFAAMTGYNILTGNPFSSSHSHSDPGFGTGYIFVPTIKTSENTYTLHGGVVVRGLTTCSLSTKANIMTTVSDYAKNVASKVSQGTTFTSNLEYEVSAEKKGVSVSTKIPPLVDAAFTSSEEFKNNENFFSEKKGVLTLQDATCSSYTVAISHSDPPPFSQAFVNALTDLNNAEESNYQAALDDFIGEFGTHFLYKTTMGARIAITRRYSGDEFRRSTNEQIQKCNNDRLKLNVGAGPSFGHTTKSCKDISTVTADDLVEGYAREVVTSYGSKPAENLFAWSKQTFDSPSPIKMELSSILNLFSKTYMKNYPNIDYKRILSWLGPLYYNYCETKKADLNIDTCKPNANKGCGWSNNCIPGQQVCNNNLNNNGFTCCTPKCHDNPCKNGGICNNITDLSCTFLCTCKSGWKGKTCEEKN